MIALIALAAMSAVAGKAMATSCDPTRTAYDYDPKNFDGMKMIDPAICMANAKGKTDDFVLFELWVPNVRPDGLADLTLGSNTLATYEVHSPKLNRLPPGVPRGAAVEPDCWSRVDFTAVPANAEARIPGNDECDKPNPPFPKCTMKQIWQRALDKGGPRDAVAALRYGWESFEERPVTQWSFRIDDDFDMTFPDDCK